jgi:hypothetical protein
MNTMRQQLEEFLRNATPDQLRDELNRGNRPFFQTLEDPALICDEQMLPRFVPAYVSFFEGAFAVQEPCSAEFELGFAPDALQAEDEELASAA